MKWLGRAVACSSWVDAEKDLACNEPYWNLCFKLGLFRRTLMVSRPLQHCVGSFDSLPAFRGEDSWRLQFITLVPSAPAGQTLHEWWRERSWRLDSPADRLCASAQGQRRATSVKSETFFVTTLPNFRERDPDFARRLETQLLRRQLGACSNRSHVLPRALTFDMRGAQKAQPFGHPLEDRKSVV